MRRILYTIKDLLKDYSGSEITKIEWKKWHDLGERKIDLNDIETNVISKFCETNNTTNNYIECKIYKPKFGFGKSIDNESNSMEIVMWFSGEENRFDKCVIGIEKIEDDYFLICVQYTINYEGGIGGSSEFFLLDQVYGLNDFLKMASTFYHSSGERFIS